LKIPEAGGEIMTSSDHRHATMKSFSHPGSREDVISILGDQSDKEYPVFQESGDDDYVKTVAVGKTASQSSGFILSCFMLLISLNMTLLEKTYLTTMGNRIFHILLFCALPSYLFFPFGPLPLSPSFDAI
jgi:hypothetical protein